jgi:hypothetical protein
MNLRKQFGQKFANWRKTESSSRVSTKLPEQTNEACKTQLPRLFESQKGRSMRNSRLGRQLQLKYFETLIKNCWPRRPGRKLRVSAKVIRLSRTRRELRDEIIRDLSRAKVSLQEENVAKEEEISAKNAEQLRKAAEIARLKQAIAALAQ